MELMIDTWNVLHQTGILPPESAGIGVQGLVSLINSSRWSGERITFVCDGTPSDNCANGPNYQTFFTGAIRRADDEIMDRVAESSSSRSIMVVTSDREIIRSIKAGGAQHIGSAAFLQALVDDNQTPKKKQIRRPSGLSAEHAQKWKREFGIDAETLEELQKTPLPRIETQKPAPKPKTASKPSSEHVVKKQRPVTPPEPILPADLLAEARRLLGDP